MQPLTTSKELNAFMQAVIVTDAQRRHVSNEQSQMDMREANQRSFCCKASVIHEGLHTYCDVCGEFCKII